MILVDSPRWQAHGTVFAHLVTDESLWQLHDFAAGIGLTVHAFDHDHYDMPKQLHADAVRDGAADVGDRELTRRLIRSGLRVRRPHRKPRPTDDQLLARWPLHEGLGRALIARWRERHRAYHNASHLAEMLTRLGELEPDVPRPVTLATWFHDAVYDGRPGNDEEASARLAETSLDGLVPAAEVAEVARLVRMTLTHDPADDDDHGKLLSDADLAILGSVPGRYHVSLRDIRIEYRHLPRADFLAGRLAVVTSLRESGLYATPAARDRWLAAARANLADEHEHLLDSHWLPDPL